MSEQEIQWSPESMLEVTIKQPDDFLKVRETLTITDRSYLLYNGEILKSGTTKDLIEDEEAKKLYLGTKFKMEY